MVVSIRRHPTTRAVKPITWHRANNCTPDRRLLSHNHNPQALTTPMNTTSHLRFLRVKEDELSPSRRSPSRQFSNRRFPNRRFPNRRFPNHRLPNRLPNRRSPSHRSPNRQPLAGPLKITNPDMAGLLTDEFIRVQDHPSTIALALFCPSPACISHVVQSIVPPFSVRFFLLLMMRPQTSIAIFPSRMDPLRIHRQL